jgi:[ribosomal protein S5]-alanine N-acetyltransferase
MKRNGTRNILTSDIAAMRHFQTFETDRLLLRPTDTGDAAFIFELLNTPKWIEFIGDRNVRSEEDARNYISGKMLPQLERLGFSNYTVLRKEDSVKLGVCGIYDRQGLEGFDLGFAFLPRYEGYGYAFEAASRLVKAAADDFEIKGLKAITTKTNISSQKLLMKLEFEFVKLIRLEGDDEELMLYQKNLKPSNQN